MVTDENGSALIGADITVVGTNAGTSTDIEGKYTLDVPTGSNNLIVSYAGYEDQEISIDGRSVINVVLAEGIALESITVIGTRGKPRTDLDSPVPIDAINGKDLIKTGQAEIAQSIHFTVPSFSAQKFGINDLAPLIDPAQLRGLGSDQTLLLVNGKRRHKVAFFNGNDGVGKGQLGNDVNSIPSAAVERVEVLRDGAAAQYGSDAIAGVVNMQLKKNRSGGTFTSYIGSTYSSPTFDDVTNKGESGEKIYGDDAVTDGFTNSHSLNFGLPWGEEGFLSTTLHFSDADATDRSGTYSHSSGWYTTSQLESVYGADAVAALDTDGDGSVSNSEKAPLDQQLQEERGIDPDRAILGTPENTNYGIFLNAGRELDEDWDFYAMGGFTKKRIIGGVFTRTPSRTSRAVPEIFFDGFNPEVPSELTDFQVLAGTKGTVGDGWSLDVSLGYSGNDVQLFARNTVNPSMGSDSPTQFYTGGLAVTQSIFNVDLYKELNEMFTLSLGTELRRETYAQQEGQRESWFPGEFRDSRDIGSSGREGFTPESTGSWDRNNQGIYAELSGDLTDAFLVTVAGRFENYSDFGSDFSFKAASRYKLQDNIALRASFNRSFRAPSLAQTHYSNFSQISFDGDGNAELTPTLPVRDARLQSAFGFSNLKQETSNDFAIGATGKFLDESLKVTVDAYQVRVNDRIFLGQVAGSNFSEFDNSGFTNINFFTNAINTVTQGLDVVVAWQNYDNEGKGLAISLAANFNETKLQGTDGDEGLNLTPELDEFFEFERTDNGSDDIIYLLEGTPRSKIILSPSYNFGPISLLARFSNFGEVTEPRLRYNAENDEWDDNPVGGGEPQVLTAITVVDLSLTGNITDNFSVTGSINNVLDTYPDMLREAQVRSEVLYSRRVNQFGTNGRFVSLALNYTWD